MYQILKAEELTTNIYLMVVKAPRVAKSCLPGQFVIVRTKEDSERIPLTICDYDRKNGTITIVFQIVGAGTQFMSELKAGDAFHDFVGPLGCPSEFCNEPLDELKKKSILFVAGGVGTAPVYPQVKWLKENGVLADVIVGAKTKDLLILEKEMEAEAGNLYITTDDGSYGRSGMVTKCLEDLIAEGHTYNHCVCIGPTIMMKFLCLTTKAFHLHTVVSMNPVMVDGDVRFACVDGPEFDGHKVDFDLALQRQTLYKTQEGEAFLAWKEGNTHHGGCGECGGER